jgi:hypothetical protein
VLDPADGLGEGRVIVAREVEEAEQIAVAESKKKWLEPG